MVREQNRVSSEADVVAADLISADTASAVRATREIPLDARDPAPEWEKAASVTFCADWQGRQPDPARQTEVRLLWTLATLYLRFECRYISLSVFEDSAPDGRRDHLWDRDVADRSRHTAPRRR